MTGKANNPQTISRESFRFAFAWMIALLLTAGSIRFVPGLRFATELWIVTAGVLTLMALRHWPPQPHPFERYVVGMMIYLPLASAIAAARSFGQPIIFGLLAQRGILICGVTLHLLRLARAGEWNPDTMTRGLVMAAGVTVSYGILIRLFVDASLLDDIPGFYVASAGEFASDATFIVFGALYFAIDAIGRGSGRSALALLVLLSYIAFIDGGRTQLAATLVVLLIIGVWFATPRQRVLFLVVAAIVPPILVAVLNWVSPGRLQSLIVDFQDAFLLVLTGEEGLDASANSRLLQIDLALPFVQEHLWFGNGLLSAQWQDGYEGIFGYLHPSDTGLFGAVFVYGIIGLILTLWQVRYGIGALRSLRGRPSSPLLKATIAFLIYWSLRTVTSGLLTLNFDWSIFIVGLLVAHQVAAERSALEPSVPK